MKIVHQTMSLKGGKAHILLCILLLVVLIFTVLGKSGQVVTRGLLTYVFILASIYSGRWCMHQMFVRRNQTYTIFKGLLMVTALSLAGAISWWKFFIKEPHFHSEVLTIIFPSVVLLMAFGMFLSLMNRERKITNRLQFIETQIDTTVIQEPVDHIFIKSGGKLFKIFFTDLLYAEASRNYTKAVIEDQNISTAISFSGFEKLLPADQFIRIHRSFIINKSKITHIEGNRIFINKYEIPIGESYKELLFQMIGLPFNCFVGSRNKA